MTSSTAQAVPAPQASSSSSVRTPLLGSDASLICVIAEDSVSLYPQSVDAVHEAYAWSSVTVAVSPAEVGGSLTAATVIATVSVALSPSPSFAVSESTALALEFDALVQVIVAIAVLMLAIVPPNTIELSSVPSPEAKDRPEVDARVNVPLCVVDIVIESSEVSSTSAMTEPVMSTATSSLGATSAAVPLHVGTSFSADTVVVNTYAGLNA